MEKSLIIFFLRRSNFIYRFLCVEHLWPLKEVKNHFKLKTNERSADLFIERKTSYQTKKRQKIPTNDISLAGIANFYLTFLINKLNFDFKIGRNIWIVYLTNFLLALNQHQIDIKLLHLDV